MRRIRKKLRPAETSESHAFYQETAPIEEVEQLGRELAAKASVVEADILSDSPPFHFDNRLSMSSRQWDDFVKRAAGL